MFLLREKKEIALPEARPQTAKVKINKKYCNILSV